MKLCISPHISEEAPEGKLLPQATELMRMATPVHQPGGRAGSCAIHQEQRLFPSGEGMLPVHKGFSISEVRLCSCGISVYFAEMLVYYLVSLYRTWAGFPFLASV